jgi:hypothetical protein
MKARIYLGALLTIYLLAAGEPLMAQGQNGVGINFNALYFKLSHKDRDPIGSGVSEEDTSTDTMTETETYTFYSLGICKFFSSVCVGARYMNNEYKSKSAGPATTDGSTTAIWNGIGLNVGYMHGGFFVNGSYYLVNNLTVKVEFGNESQKSVYDSGTAYSLDFGYAFDVNGNVKVGPQISYTHFDYQKIKVDGKKTSLDYDVEDTHIIPQVALWYIF